MGHSFLTFKSHKSFPRCTWQRVSKQTGSLSSDRDLQGHAHCKMTKERTRENLNTVLSDSRSGTKTNHQTTDMSTMCQQLQELQRLVPWSRISSQVLSLLCCQTSHITFLSFSFPFYEIGEIAYLTAKSKVLYLISHGTHN